MSGIQKEYGSKGVQVIGGTIDTEGMPVTKAFIAKYSPAFPVGESEYNAMMRFAGYSPMVRTYVPFLFFIDRKGTIRAQYMGSDSFFREEIPNIRKMIDGLLKESAAAGASTPAAAKPPAKAAPAAKAPTPASTAPPKKAG